MVPSDNIVQAGDPVLRARAAEIPPAQIATPEFQGLVDRMIATMRAAPGVGLAAPQIGVPLRVIVLEDTEQAASQLGPEQRRERERAAFALRVLVNPVLRIVGTERALFFEGCLSVDGFAALVERAVEVEVSGLDRDGRPQSWRVRGWPARILQHEVDHLDGTLYIDRMLPRSFTTREHLLARYAQLSAAELLRLFA